MEPTPPGTNAPQPAIPAPSLAQQVYAVVEETLERSWREGERDGVAYGYHSPSPTTYPWQWYWDSCLIAIANRHVNPARSRQELQSLLKAADKTGFIGHTIFWGSHVTWSRLPFYNVVHRRDKMTSTIQPPLLAWAWSIAVGDPALEPALVAHQEEIQRRRDLEGDGLIWIIQPDESGLDASPMFDPVWGRHANGRPGFIQLVAHNRRLGFDARRIAQAGGPVVCDPLTNTLNGLSRLALGMPSITPALVAKLWDPKAEIFKLAAKPGMTSTPADTIAGLAPLALPDLPDAIGHALVRRYLLDHDRFWAEVGPPSVALNEPSFSVNDRRHHIRQYWRGPTWVNTAWLVWLGLQRLGYVDEALRLATSIGETVVREGLREYYNPFTGEGMGALNFGWTALALDMQHPSPEAAMSYIPPARLAQATRPLPPAPVAKRPPTPPSARPHRIHRVVRPGVHGGGFGVG